MLVKSSCQCRRLYTNLLILSGSELLAHDLSIVIIVCQFCVVELTAINLYLIRFKLVIMLVFIAQ